MSACFCTRARGCGTLALGEIVRVGAGTTTWRIVEFWCVDERGQRTQATLIADTMARLERVDRAGVHTTVSIDRVRHT